MAESGLSFGFPDIQAVVGEFLDYGSDSTNWSAGVTASIDRIIQSGYRQYIYPPAVQGIEAGYEWTFLKPVTTITTTADDKDQDMPDDFGRLINGFTYADDAQVPPVLAPVGEARIRESRLSFAESGRPRIAAIRVKAGTGTTGQRFEVMWFPDPDDAYVLTYRYEAFVGKLTTDLPYPLGGMSHSELLRESCLAAAELFADDERGVHWEAFLGLLAAGIIRDNRRDGVFFGQTGVKYEYSSFDDDPYRTYRGAYGLTVGGTEIE